MLHPIWINSLWFIRIGEILIVVVVVLFGDVLLGKVDLLSTSASTVDDVGGIYFGEVVFRDFFCKNAVRK